MTTVADRAAVDAVTANDEMYELGRQHALAAVAATASLLLEAGQPECATMLLAGIASAHSAMPGPRVPAVDLRPGGGRDGSARNQAEMRRVGDMWRITFAGVSVHLPHRKGLGDLAVLLARPGREIAAFDLAAATAPGASRSATAETDALGMPGDLGERLDARARTAYTARIRELQGDLDDADAAGDAERSARAQHELDFLTRELSAAYGLRGPRRTGDPAEKARSAVTLRIRASLAAIRDVHPALGVHLHRSVSTGRLCGYNPEEQVTWRVTS